MSDPRKQKLERIGIVFALEAEKRGLERVMAESRAPVHSKKSHSSLFIGEVQVITAVSGIGRKRCAEATQLLISSGAQCIICAGFSAALDPDARIGDVVVANRIHLLDGSIPVLNSDPHLLRILPPGDTFKFRIRWCDFVTSDSIVCNELEKTRIYRATSAAALDMESYGAAEVCNRCGIPFLTIRSISDTAEQDLPQEICTLAAIGSKKEQILYALLRPGIWANLLRLSKQTSIAADNLGDVLGLMLLRLI